MKLVNTLLDFSRLEAGRLQPLYEPIDLAAYTAELASTFQSAMDKAGLRYVIDCQRVTAPTFVDHDMWEKIVLNLISNAFKYTFEGEVEVSLGESADQSRVELRVRDTGLGIPSSELPRLFERFHRIEGQHGRTHEGTGIGLALVQELAHLHGGTVEATSAPGPHALRFRCRWARSIFQPLVSARLALRPRRHIAPRHSSKKRCDGCQVSRCGPKSKFRPRVIDPLAADGAGRRAAIGARGR